MTQVAGGYILANKVWILVGNILTSSLLMRKNTRKGSYAQSRSLKCRKERSFIQMRKYFLLLIRYRRDSERNLGCRKLWWCSIFEPLSPKSRCGRQYLFVCGRWEWRYVESQVVVFRSSLFDTSSPCICGKNCGSILLVWEEMRNDKITFPLCMLWLKF